jgi:hypothetical protein
MKLLKQTTQELGFMLLGFFVLIYFQNHPRYLAFR